MKDRFGTSTITVKLTTLMLVITGSILSLTSCDRNGSGTYLVYKVERSNKTFGATGVNDSLNSALENKLLGNRFNIDFGNDHVSLISQRTGQETVLARMEQNGKITYVSNTKKEGVDIHLEMRTDEEGHLMYMCEVNAIYPRDRPVFLPVQLGGPFTTSRTARAICYLSKVQ